MTSTSPLPTAHARLASRTRAVGAAGGLACLAALACADVLDIPDHPHLGNDTQASHRGTRSRSPDTEIDRASAADQDAGVRTDAGTTLAEPTGPATPPPDDTLVSSQSTSRGGHHGSGSIAEEIPDVLDAGAGGLVDAAVEEPAEPDAAPPPPAVDPCTLVGVRGPDGRCYVNITQELSWLAARERCRNLGAGWDLASIRNRAVYQFLSELIARDAWIGASDRSVEGTWRWVDDGTPFWSGDATGYAIDDAFVCWSSGQPNGGDGADCARLLPGGAGWADLPCTELHDAICAASLPQ